MRVRREDVVERTRVALDAPINAKTSVSLLAANGGGDATLNVGLTTITWDAIGLNQATWTHSAGVFTVPAAIDGRFLEFYINVGGIVSGANRVQMSISLQVDTGGGYATVATAEQYAMRNATQNQGGATLAGFIHGTAASTGDTWRVQVSIVGAASTIKNTSCHMSIKAYG